MFAVLQGDESLAREIAEQERLLASTLTFLEGHRALLRALNNREIPPRVYTALKKQMSDIEQSCALRAIDQPVLSRAREPFFVEPVRSLDAIHLATIDLAKAAGLELVFSTDPRVAQNADAMGLRVRPAAASA
ncbi:MAG: PIN domain-containing protein [Deltaproteobacteria bacterium]|nr:PIN domain-containing protein [Deltaproteobacteria bacterium]